MKPPSAAGELFIHSGKFGEVRMKPKNCGNKLFIHSANINEVWLAIDTSPCYVYK